MDVEGAERWKEVEQTRRDEMAERGGDEQVRWGVCVEWRRRLSRRESAGFALGLAARKQPFPNSERLDTAFREDSYWETDLFRSCTQRWAPNLLQSPGGAFIWRDEDVKFLHEVFALLRQRIQRRYREAVAAGKEDLEWRSRLFTWSSLDG